jgi:hypothetical protein
MPRVTALTAGTRSVVKCYSTPVLRGSLLRAPGTELAAEGIIPASVHQSAATKIYILIIFSRLAYVRLVIIPT